MHVRRRVECFLSDFAAEAFLTHHSTCCGSWVSFVADRLLGLLLPEPDFDSMTAASIGAHPRSAPKVIMSRTSAPANLRGCVQAAKPATVVA